MELKNVALDEIKNVAGAVLEMLDHQEVKVCLIKGEMGSGKTTLVRDICQLLEVEDNVASPTFSLVNEYKSKFGPIYHFDFYRLKSVEEALDAGVEEYFYSGHLCLIEWPELIAAILPPDTLNIDIDSSENLTRNYKLITHESDKTHRI